VRGVLVEVEALYLVASPGLDPAGHVFIRGIAAKTWMAGSSRAKGERKGSGSISAHSALEPKLMYK
jgi:hypothetical protein